MSHLEAPSAPGPEADSPRIEEVDLLVVGGGKAGKSLAMTRAKAGGSAVMVERDKISGTCINVACIPTKTLVSSARVLREVQGAADHGVALEGEGSAASALARARIDLAALRARKDAVVGGMVAAHRDVLYPGSGMDFVLGTARFIAPRTARIALADGSIRAVRGRAVLINTATPSRCGPARTCSPSPSFPITWSSWGEASSGSRCPPSWGSSASRSPSSTPASTSWTARTPTSPPR